MEEGGIPPYVYWIVITLVICALGILGNLLSGIVLLQKEFRSSTNYFLLALSAVDFWLLILGFIRTLAKVESIIYWNPNGPFGTLIFFWAWICNSGTQYFTVAISLERYLAVCHPFKARKWITERRALITALSVFLFTCLYSSWNYAYKYYIVTGYALYVAITLRLIPFVTVLALNVFIYRGVKEFHENRKKLTAMETKEMSINRMLLCVVLVFGVCNSFEFLRQILIFSNYFDPKLQYDAYIINHLSSLFYVLNSSANFVVYFLMVEKFRKSFLKLFCRCYPCSKKNQGVEAVGSGSSLGTGTEESNI